MSDREQQQREQAYRIWEAEGRGEGRHEDHWRRAGEELDLTEQESEDVVKANQEADAEFHHEHEQEPGLLETVIPPLGGNPD